MFACNRVKVICVDGILEIPEAFIDEWSSYKGLLNVSEELCLDSTINIVEKLLNYQIYFKMSGYDSKTKINDTKEPFNKKGILNLSLDVYKLAHFVGLMNIVEFVTNNIFYMPDLNLIDNFFRDWNKDQIAKINPDEFANTYLRKITELYIGGAIFLEEILKNIFFRMYEKSEFDYTDELCYYSLGKYSLTKFSQLATHISISPYVLTLFPDKPERILQSIFYFKYKWYLNRIENVVQNTKEKTTPVKISINDLFESENFDPIFLIISKCISVTCIDQEGKRCILFKSRASVRYDTGLYRCDWDPENIDKLLDNCKLISFSDLPLYKPDPSYKIVEFDLSIFIDIFDDYNQRKMKKNQISRRTKDSNNVDKA